MQLYQRIAYEGSIYGDQKNWVSYSPSVEVSSRILRPSAQWRRDIYSRIRDLCIKHGLEFSTCKEGFYDYHTAENCCGMHLLDKEKYF